VVKKWKLWPLVTRRPFDLYQTRYSGRRKKEIVNLYIRTLHIYHSTMQTNATGWTLLTTSPAVLTTYWYFSCRSEPAPVLFSTPCRRHAVPPFVALDPSLPTTLFRIGHWSGFDTTATFSLLFMFNALIAFDSHIIKCSSSFTSPSIPHIKQRNEINKFIQKTFKKKIYVFFMSFYWLWIISIKQNILKYFKWNISDSHL